MKFCLNKELLEAFLKSRYDADKYPLEDDNLIAIIDGAFSWEFEVSLLTYFFSSYIQRRANSDGFDNQEFINFYQLIHSGNFTYQQFDRDFIDYLFNYSRTKMKMNLEELLVIVQQDLVNNNYDSSLRY